MLAPRRSLTGFVLALGLLAGSASAQVSHFGTGCAGSLGAVPGLDASLPHTGQTFFVEVTGPPLTFGVLFVGLSNTQLGGLSLPLEIGGGCQILVSGNVQVPVLTDSAGDYRLSARGFQPGVTLYAQVYLMGLGSMNWDLGGFSAGLSLTGAGYPRRGDLILTEIMQNPTFVSDAAGEWFEVRNLLPFGLNVEGWTIRDKKASHRIAAGGRGVVIPPNGSFVFGRNGNPVVNGGIRFDYVYGPAIKFSNASDRIALRAYDNSLIDRVVWDDGATFPDPIGASMALSRFSYDEAANDFGEFWCESHEPIVSFPGNPDRGTPGADNAECPQ